MKKKTVAILLSLTMVLSLFSGTAFALGTTSDFSDMPSNWSTEALENAVSNGLLMGYDGEIMPNDNLTRAQMATVVNRAFGTTEKASLSSYTDVAANAWYYDDMAKAVQMKTFVGYDGKLEPDKSITREEAFAVLARAFKLSGAAESALDKFSDKALVSNWAKGEVSSLVAAGYIVGYNGQLNPKQYITRAEFAQMMDNLLKNYIKTAGTYTADINGNAMINVPDVTLKNIKITGDLIIGDGVGNGDVTLDGITVTGRTIIRGGGGVNSIEIIGNSSLQSIIIARVDGQVRVYAEDGTQIGEVTVDGSDNVIIEGNFGAVTVTAPDITVTATNADIVDATIEGENSKIIIAANSTVNTVYLNVANAKIDVLGQVTKIETSKEADNATVRVLSGAKVTSVVVNGTGTRVGGSGTVGTVTANANNIAVTTPNTAVTAATGTTGVTAGATPVTGGTTGTSTPVETVGGTTDVVVSAITVTGDAVVGATLTAVPTPAGATATYQWQIATEVDGVYADITGETANTYTPVPGDETKYIKVLATGTGNYSGTVASAAIGAVALAGVSVNLGMAGDYVILAKTGISTVPTSAITGNIGVSPVAATGITGFDLAMDATNVFSTSSQVTGKVYAPGYADSTPSNLTTAISNMETAYTDAAGRAADYTELYTGDISGQTLTAGVYKWGTGVLINADVTLNGGANDVFIFQISQGITQANGTSIILAGGAQAKNIFWQAADTVAIGTGAHFEGIILSMTNITLGTGASINGRLLAQTAVTLDASTVK